MDQPKPYTLPDFENLVSLYKNKVYNTALSILQNKEDAEDVTQDVFVKVYDGLSSFRQEAEISTWVYRITVNKAIDYHRKQIRRKGIFAALFVNTEGEAMHFEHPGVITEKKEMAALLFASLQKLPPLQKAVFVLHKIEGIEQQQIAEILNTSRMAVEAHMKRAKKNMAKYLKPLYDNRQF